MSEKKCPDCGGEIPHEANGYQCLRNQRAKLREAITESDNLIEAIAHELPPHTVWGDENIVVHVRHIVEDNPKLQAIVDKLNNFIDDLTFYNCGACESNIEAIKKLRSAEAKESKD